MNTEITLSLVFSAVGAVGAFLVSNAKFQERLEQLTKRYENTKTELSELIKEKDEIMLKVKTRDTEIKYINDFISEVRGNAGKHGELENKVTKLQTDLDYVKETIARIEKAVTKQ